MKDLFETLTLGRTNQERSLAGYALEEALGSDLNSERFSKGDWLDLDHAIAAGSQRRWTDESDYEEELHLHRERSYEDE